MQHFIYKFLLLFKLDQLEVKGHPWKNNECRIVTDEFYPKLLTVLFGTGWTEPILSNIGCLPCLIAIVSVNSGLTKTQFSNLLFRHSGLYYIRRINKNACRWSFTVILTDYYSLVLGNLLA